MSRRSRGKGKVGVSNRPIGIAVAAHFAERGYRDCLAIGHAQRTDTRSAARVAGFGEGLPRAVFRTSGQLTVALHLAIRKADLSFPGQVALMSLDSDLAGMVDPPLSVVRVRTYDFGLRASDAGRGHRFRDADPRNDVSSA